MRNIIIIILAIILLAHFKAENVRQDRDIANIKGHMRDQANTTYYLTHPATMEKRYFDWHMSRGEFAEPK